MWGWRAFLFLMGLVVLPPAFTPAATFQGLDVFEDGSGTPPGDVLRVRMTLYPEDRELKYEIRAYVIPIAAGFGPPPGDEGGAPPEAAPRRVRTANRKVRDADGNYLQVVTRPCPRETVAHPESFTVAFADLGLQRGTYRLGYEVRVLRGEVVQFTCASPLDKIEITAEAREMFPRVPHLDPLDITREMVCLQDGQLVTVPRKETILLDSFEPGPVAVMVPGGYQRLREFFAVDPGENPTPEELTAISVNSGRLSWAAHQSPPIYFATNRLIRPQAPVKERFTTEESPTLSYGFVRVNLPQEGHVPGNIETPKHWWNSLDAKKHFFLEDTTTILPEDEAFRLLAQAFEIKANDLVIFVHGFNNSFEDAAMRLAQLRLDTHFPGQVLLFSWPSVGSATPASYEEDEKRSERATPHLTALLRRLAIQRSATPDPGDIHLIAHSMGNRVLLGALMELSTDPQVKGTQPFGHVVFAAPDEMAQKFALQVKQISGLARTRTLYFCMDDLALRASQQFHNNVNRAGQVLIPIAELDNVDSIRANTSILGHDYFVSANPLLVDIERLLNLDCGPKSRPPLALDKLVNYEFWKFP